MDNHSLRSTLSTGISWDEMSSLKVFSSQKSKFAIPP